MPHLTVLSLLLTCAVSLSSSAIVVENGMPLLWNQLGDLSPQGSILAVNPWQIFNRMAIYRLMIDATNPLMDSMGPGDNQNPMFGLPLQLGWMLTSGRLADPTGTTNCGMDPGEPACISTASWWACENYFVSVLPFLSAVQNKFLGEDIQVVIQAADGATELCTTYAECLARFPDAMTKWDNYFKGLLASGASSAPDNEKKDTLLGLYWEAQMASTYASSACDARKNLLSGPELSFANAWLNSTEYVAAAHFQSSLELASKFLEPLPSQVLREDDVAPNIERLSQEENQMLKTFTWLDSINTTMGGTLVSVWQKAMCTVSTREKGRAMLERILLNSDYNAFSLMGDLTLMAAQCA
ncbi:protein LEG1 homolog [Halichoeres trimaculatus]|uniref:protein LEG1 homolog n=1 Tax=Halichoeres trimaculatus TaxID=147232 RepID=UPI003D9F4AC0